jgi:hypothetical protein
VGRTLVARLFACLTLSSMIASCGGGGSSSNPPVSPTPPPTTSASTAVSPNAPASGTFAPITGGLTAAVTIPAASTNATVTTAFSASAPSGAPQLQNVGRRPANIGSGSISPLAFITMTSNATVSFGTTPSFTLTPASGVTSTLASLSYVAEYDPTNPSAGWTTVLGPATLQGSSLSFSPGQSPITLAAGRTYIFVVFTVATALPVPSPTPTPVFCASTARQGFAHLAARYPGAAWIVPNQLAVTYRASAASRAPQSIDRTVSSVHTLDLGVLSGNGHRVLTLASGTDMTAAAATLRQSADVIAVDAVHYRRPSSYPNAPTPLNSNDLVNDPFSDNVDQWYLYQTSTNPTAWQTTKGASNVSIAIIDTGVDLTNKDFVFASQESVVNGVIGNTLNGVPTAAQDTDGHGTNVAGLAAAQANNLIGFAGVGYGTKVQAYKIFPDDSATNPCPSASTADEAQAINDAVKNHASVISLSLGSPQSAGSDATEKAAIENAIAAGVTVVAANGNEYPSSDGNLPDYPAAYPGVIAVGASAVADDNIGATYSAITSETVASYSNSGPTLLAPGGDASGSQDNDALHWITGYSTTTAGVPANACSGRAGLCVALFNGTSQATPQVSGAIALILAAHGGAGTLTPAQIKQILMTTADPLSGIPATRQGAGRLNVAKAVTAP